MLELRWWRAVLSRRTQANDLAILISRMQTKADKVEKNILHSEQLMDVVGRPLIVIMGHLSGLDRSF